MRLVQASPAEPGEESEIETVVLTPTQLAFLGRLSRGINPAMPSAFGDAHAVRTLLERLEEAQLDLSAASSEDEIARIASAALRQRKRRSR
ncbi:MAG TPA: hypothetical protein VNA04_14380 [Thermoanaerobaculia bacterium]|nr:hypothetical protein [Thermoanaerobaculia bacterium]